MRVTVLVLLLANLLYMGWAEWIDVPGPPAPNPTAGLKHLTLVSELPPDKRAALAKKMSLAAAPPQCVSVGPFDDPAIASQAAALLRAKSFAPQQRAVESPDVRRFWVYLEGFASDAGVTHALHKLERGGIDDAEAMPPATGRRISLGLFNDRDHADRRAKLVRTMGFKPAITERMLPGTVYWLDLTLPNGSAPVPLKDVSGLEPGGGSTSPVGVQSCPTGAATATPPAAPSPVPAAPGPALQKAPTATGPVSAATLPRCKPGGGGPVPCIVLKEAKQPSVL